MAKGCPQEECVAFAVKLKALSYSKSRFASSWVAVGRPLKP